MYHVEEIRIQKNTEPYYDKNSVYIFRFFVGVEFIRPEKGSMNRIPTFT